MRDCHHQAFGPHLRVRFVRARIVMILGAVCLGLSASAGTYQTQQEALKESFGSAEIRRDAVFLTKAQQTRIAELSGQACDSEIVYVYAAYEGAQRIGTAYFDVHRVRTLAETLMVVVGSDDTIHELRVLAFHEPEEYLPPARWFKQLVGRALDNELALKRGVQGIAGATLSSRAAIDAARRILATHTVIGDKSGP